jgi:hypothetical protein
MSEIGNIIRDTQAGWLKEKARADALAVDVERLTRDYKIKYDICVSLDAHVAAEKAANERLRAAIAVLLRKLDNVRELLRECYEADAGDFGNELHRKIRRALGLEKP